LFFIDNKYVPWTYNIINRKGIGSVVSVAIEYTYGFLTLEFAPFLHAPKTSLVHAEMEQILMKKYL